MIGAVVDHHEGLFGHMAFHAQSAIAGLTFVNPLMEMVLIGIVGIRLVTLQTQLIPGFVQLE
ncbi:MAG: hypothetical protein ABGY96_16825, partial [bacterium]